MADGGSGQAGRQAGRLPLDQLDLRLCGELQGMVTRHLAVLSIVAKCIAVHSREERTFRGDGAG